MPHYSDSAIFVILLVILDILLVIFMILSNIIETTLSHSYCLHPLQLLDIVQPFCLGGIWDYFTSRTSASHRKSISRHLKLHQLNFIKNCEVDLNLAAK
jgi:hypothetical protein